MILFTLKGKLTSKTPVSSGQGSRGEWRKITFVLSTDGRSKKDLAITAWHEQCDQIIDAGIGSELTVGCDVSSREYNGKWYTDVTAKEIQGDLFVPVAKPAVEQPKPSEEDDFFSSAAPAPIEKFSMPKSTSSNTDISTDDLPF